MCRASLVLGLTCFLACVIACTGAGSGTGGSTVPDRKSAPAPTADKVTKAMFDRIEIGDSLEAVVTVAEFPDDLVSHDKSTKTWVYLWKNPDGSWMSVTLQGNNVVKKLQVGLK